MNLLPHCCSFSVQSSTGLQKIHEDSDDRCSQKNPVKYSFWKPTAEIHFLCAFVCFLVSAAGEPENIYGWFCLSSPTWKSSKAALEKAALVLELSYSTLGFVVEVDNIMMKQAILICVHIRPFSLDRDGVTAITLLLLSSSLLTLIRVEMGWVSGWMADLLSKTAAWICWRSKFESKNPRAGE